MKQPKYITLNGSTYTEGSRCPACSAEKDTGGRLEFKKRTNWYLKCFKCRYTVHGERAKNKQALYVKKKRDANLGIRTKWKGRIKKKKPKLNRALRIEKKKLKELKRLRAEQQKQYDEMKKEFAHLLEKE